MKLRLDRKWKKKTYTIGNLYVDGKFFCNTLEDKDRGLNRYDNLHVIQARKVYGETAIPTGSYDILMDVVSPKYKAVSWYNSLCGGRMPRLDRVPGFDGILIHPGTTALDTLGCILVGRNTKVGQLTESRATFAKLYSLLKAAYARHEAISIDIVS